MWSLTSSSDGIRRLSRATRLTGKSLSKRSILGDKRLRERQREGRHGRLLHFDSVLLCFRGTAMFWRSTFMTAADWHIVQSGHPQILGNQRQIRVIRSSCCRLFPPIAMRTRTAGVGACRRKGDC
jgi:hypothetical protein